MCTGLALSPRQWTDRAELAQEPQGRKKVSAQNHIRTEAQGWPGETSSWLTRAIEEEDSPIETDRPKAESAKHSALCEAQEQSALACRTEDPQGGLRLG